MCRLAVLYACVLGLIACYDELADLLILKHIMETTVLLCVLTHAYFVFLSVVCFCL